MLSSILLATAVLAAPQDCSSSCKSSEMAMTTGSTKTMMTTTAEQDIVAVAAGAGQFKTLLAAATAAGLAPVLQSEGPLTVFAPTDEAFAKLPAGTVETLLKPENKDLLVSILTYHVVPGRMMAADVLKQKNLKTVNGQRPAIAMKNGKPMIGKAAIVGTDIKASNGVIHVIDQVIIPEKRNIIEVATDAKMFNTLAAALTEAELVETLQSKGPFTVLAPTDDAFAKLPAGTVETLLKPENRDQLKAILLYHVIPGRVYADQVVTLSKAPTASGVEAPIVANDKGVTVGGAKVIKTDIEASNGVVHVVDTVMIP